MKFKQNQAEKPFIIVNDIRHYASNNHIFMLK